MTVRLADTVRLIDTVRLTDVVVTHGGKTLVDVPALHLPRGRPVTIVGESGSGKSLLAHALVGTLAPGLAARGRLTLDGDVHDLADATARRRLWGRTLALLPQEPVLALDPTMRAVEQVAEGHPRFRADRRAARAAALGLLGRLGLERATRAFPHTLSGGMAQRVAFAAATIGGAPVLVADEPSKGLDRAARDGLAALLTRHVDGGGALLTITHDLDLARRLGGDVLVMREATVVESGPAGQVLAEPTHAYTRRLLAAEPSRWDRPWTGVDAAGGAESLVAARGLAVTLGGRRLFAGLDVDVRAGERLVVSGPSGCGKTTLGNVLLGLRRPDAGHVRRSPGLGGGRLQKLYQDPAVAFPARVPVGTAIGDLVRRHRRDPARVDGLLTALRLDPALLARRPGQVSGGELQRLAIIRAMLLDPALVFADEPTSRLDLVTQEETVRCLLGQLVEADCALVLVTHDEALADAVAERRLALGTDVGTEPLVA